MQYTTFVKSTATLLMFLPYGFVAILVLLTLTMSGGNPQAGANVLFAVIWMTIPWLVAKKLASDPANFKKAWATLAWVFALSMIPVAEALYFFGIDL